MEIDLSSENPPESSHEKCYEPRKGKTYPYKNLIYRCDLQCDRIRKANSDDLRSNLSKKQDRQKGKYINDRRRQMIREAKYSDHLRSDVFLCYERRSTRNQKCSDEIRHKQLLISFLETIECTSSEFFLFDPAIEFMLTHGHEWDLRPGEKGKTTNKSKKQH